MLWIALALLAGSFIIMVRASSVALDQGRVVWHMVLAWAAALIFLFIVSLLPAVTV